jgi:hypothetical protein
MEPHDFITAKLKHLVSAGHGMVWGGATSLCSQDRLEILPDAREPVAPNNTGCVRPALWWTGIVSTG